MEVKNRLGSRNGDALGGRSFYVYSRNIRGIEFAVTPRGFLSS